MLLECVLTADTAELRRGSTGEAHMGFLLEPCRVSLAHGRRNGHCIRERSDRRSATGTGARDDVLGPCVHGDHRSHWKPCMHAGC